MSVGSRSTRFGNIVVVLFLIAQACDGVLTYVGVRIYGLPAEGNPLLGWLMASVGAGAALTTAKTVAGAFGIALHLVSVHKVVAALAILYLVAAVVPWMGLLFF